MTTKTYHRRHLPHYYPENSVFFVTFRLAGSLPISVIKQLKVEATEGLWREKQNEISRWERQFTDYETTLNSLKNDARWLADSRVADLVRDAIHYQDGRDYDLASYCIMPNHVHIVFGLGEHSMFDTDRQTGNLSNKTLSQVMQSLKRYTAREANKILERSGPFWQNESFDRVIRSDEELEKIILYIMDNPVKAGLVKKWEEWKWNYSRFLF